MKFASDSALSFALSARCCCTALGRARAAAGAALTQVSSCQAWPSRAISALAAVGPQVPAGYDFGRSEEHTSELQSLMRISYAVFCLKKKKTKNTQTHTNHN